MNIFKSISMNRLGIKHSYDKLWVGIVTGIVIPFVMYAVLLSISDALAGMEGFPLGGIRERTLTLIALLSNVIPMQVFYRRHWDDSMRGMVFPTLIYAGIWFYRYGSELLNSF